VIRISEIGPPVPRLPHNPWSLQLAASVSLHLTLATVLVALGGGPPTTAAAAAQKPPVPRPVEVRHFVFIARDPFSISGGGGGGGNRQTGPIRRAQGVGSDKITLRRRKSRLRSWIVRGIFSSRQTCCSTQSRSRLARSTRWAFQRAACLMEHRPDRDLAAALEKAPVPASDLAVDQASVRAQVAGVAAASIGRAAR
jgi:hypothetical protein